LWGRFLLYLQALMQNKTAQNKIPLHQNKVIIITTLIFVVLLIIFLIRHFQPNLIFAPGDWINDHWVIATKLEENIPNTEFDFQEMTIPYLKNRPYKSNLTDLNQALETSEYTGYLTSYESDGLTINGLLTIPKGKVPADGFPAAVFVHGYISPNSYQTLENYNSFVDYLTRQGLVVFKIDLRGHADSEGEASGAYYSGDYVVDVLNAYSALEQAEFVNKEKIGLWGHSMAGNVVLRAMVAKPSIPKVVILAGAVYTYEDFVEFGIDDDSYRPPATDSPRRQRREQLFNTYGEFDSNSWFWQQVPATNYLDGVMGEVQIHHAINDNVVDIEYSRNLHDILNQAGIINQLFEYQSGGHNLTGATFNQAMQRSAKFFK
jgi:uncharacterized protein